MGDLSKITLPSVRQETDRPIDAGFSTFMRRLNFHIGSLRLPEEQNQYVYRLLEGIILICGAEGTSPLTLVATIKQFLIENCLPAFLYAKSDFERQLEEPSKQVEILTDKCIKIEKEHHYEIRSECWEDPELGKEYRNAQEEIWRIKNNFIFKLRREVIALEEKIDILHNITRYIDQYCETVRRQEENERSIFRMLC